METAAKNKTQIEEINYSSRGSFLLSHHHTSSRRSLHITHWLEKCKNMRTLQVNFSILEYKTSVTCWATKFHKDQVSPMSITVLKKIQTRQNQHEINLRTREWMRTLFPLMAIITGKEFSIKRLPPRLIVKSDDVDGIVKENVSKKRRKFRFSRGEFNFEDVPCWFLITPRIVPQDLLGVFCFKSRYLCQCHRCEFGHHKEIFVYASTCR